MMNRDEAKSILSALRSEEEGHFNSEIAEAFRLMESDPALAEWFQEIRQFDSIVSERLKSFPVPPGLKSSILREIQTSQKPIRKRRLIIGMLTAGAAAALLIGLAVWPGMFPANLAQQSGTASEFQRDMLRQIEGLKSIDHISDEPGSVSNFLNSHEVHPDFEIPKSIDLGKLAGCKIVHWKGTTVSLICYNAPEGNETPRIHLMTIDAGAIRKLKHGEERQMKVNQWSSTVWRVGNQVHLLAVKNREKSDLRKLVPFG